MKRFNGTMAAALICAAFGATAIAQDKPTAPATSPNPGKTQAAPTKEEVQQQHADPKNETMDSNAQRQHSRDTASPSQSKESSAQQPVQQAQAGGVRNWGAIDKNHDNLISPDEMEAELKQGSKGGTTQQ